MELQRDKNKCEDHTIEIVKLRGDMENRVSHEERTIKAIEKIEEFMNKIDKNYYEVNSTLLHIKDIPERVRKLEDKSIITTIIEKGLWFILGIGITIIIQQRFVAPTKDEHIYKNEINK